MNRSQFGYCHICGTYGKLSFEHIPPENALNNEPAKIYTGEEALKRFQGEPAKYINQQKGMGKDTLCESCNNKTGSWYANAYSIIAKSFALQLCKKEELKHGEFLEFSSEAFPSLSFVKQVITMFCSLLPLSDVQRLGFDKLLLDKESNNVDRGLFDLRMYLTSIKTKHLLIGPCAALYKTETGAKVAVVSDLCVYPFGFILNMTPEYHVEFGASIMGLLDAKYGEEYKMGCTLMYLERMDNENPLPLMYKPLP